MNEVVIKTPMPPEDPAHIAAMVAKADGVVPPVAAEVPAERPAWLPEGFNTPEELAAAYAKTKEAPVEPSVEATQEAALEAVTKAGLDMSALEAKVIETGALEASDYAALEAAGITKATVDQFIEGRRAVGEALSNRVFAHVGGQDQFSAIVDWAAEGNMTPAEAAVYNRAVDSGDETAIMMALDGIKAKFMASGNNSPALLGGGRGGATGAVYESVQQMMDDMRNPAYSKDPAFRAMVSGKLSRSDIM